MATYTIRVLNNSVANRSYAIFMAPPVVTANGAATPVFTNAWAAFTNITDGAWDSVIYTDKTYAFWGQALDRLGPGAILDCGGAKPVDTATADTVTFTNTGATGFASVTSPGEAQSGSFSIITSTDFTPLNNFVLGLASDNGSPIPSPVASFDAQPNEVYNITPVVKFYVTNQYCEPGQVIKPPAQPCQIAEIDFTGRPQTAATVVQGSNGEFNLVYA